MLAILPEEFRQPAHEHLRQHEVICQRILAYYGLVIDEHQEKFPAYVLEHVPAEFQRGLFGHWRKQNVRNVVEKLALRVYASKLAMPQ